MENLCNKERDEHITELNKSIMKYDTYWYRSIIGRKIMRKVTKKGKVNGFEAQMHLLCWELLFSMLCMDKGSSINLNLMIFGNMLWSWLCWCLYVYMYVCMLMSNRVVRDHSFGGMIAYASEWHEEVLGLLGIKWEK